MSALKDPVAAFNARHSTFKYDEARSMLHVLKAWGMRVLKSARSAHGSDCNEQCMLGNGTAPSRIAGCRCIRVYRLRVEGSGDWLLLFGDMQEGYKVQLQGPYHHDTPLSYGGGFWCKVSL